MKTATRSRVTRRRIALGVGVLFSACFIGRDISAPRQRGILINRHTGEAIAGAEIFRFHRKEDPLLRVLSFGMHGSPLSRRSDWATTDSQGRFEFVEHEIWQGAHWLSWRGRPGFMVVDPCRGYGGTVFTSTLPGGELQLSLETRSEANWKSGGSSLPDDRSYRHWVQVLERGPREECTP